MPAIPPPISLAIANSQYDATQYSLRFILFIWASVTLPMGLLAWVIAPWMIPRVNMNPGVLYWLLMIIGMMWQCVVAVIVLRREQRHWNLAALKERLWLNPPIDPRTGQKKHWLWLVLIPAIFFSWFSSDYLGSYLDAPLHWFFPSFQMPFYTNIRQLNTPELVGCWWLIAIAVISSVFNYVLGEALLFHGVLLPKMKGVFGERAWLANGVLFGLYHVHLVGSLPSIIISNFAYSFPAQRYRSNGFAIIVHGVEGIVLIVMVAMVVLGMSATQSGAI